MMSLPLTAPFRETLEREHRHTFRYLNDSFRSPSRWKRSGIALTVRAPRGMEFPGSPWFVRYRSTDQPTRCLQSGA